MLGYNDANYVPGWDCHGLPIEWKIEEQYRAKGRRTRIEVPINEFRKECRRFRRALDRRAIARSFKRLGVIGDWDAPYTDDERIGAESVRSLGEVMKFAMTGRPFVSRLQAGDVVGRRKAPRWRRPRSSMHDLRERITIWVKFPLKCSQGVNSRCASVVIWTTTPWTIPGNRAVSYSPRIAYGLYEVHRRRRTNNFGPHPGDRS